MFALIDTFVFVLALGLARAGWRRGFASQTIDLLGFAVAVLAAVRLATMLSGLYRAAGLGPGSALLAGGLTVFVPIIVVVAIVGAKVGRIVSQPGLRMTDKVLGLGAGVAWAAVAVAVLLLGAQLAPVPAAVAEAVRRSPTAGALLPATEPVTRVLQSVAGRDAEKWLLYLRQSSGEPRLRFPAADPATLAADPGAERELGRLVNSERRKNKLPPLSWDDGLTEAARARSREMYVGGYLTKDSPERNVALAPTVELAHRELMRSQAGRRSILDSEFHKLGVGIVGGPHGLMASLEFCRC